VTGEGGAVPLPAGTIACTQVEIAARRWYVILRITLPDGTIAERVISDPDMSGLVVFGSVAEYRARAG